MGGEKYCGKYLRRKASACFYNCNLRCLAAICLYGGPNNFVFQKIIIMLRDLKDSFFAFVML